MLLLVLRACQIATDGTVYGYTLEEAAEASDGHLFAGSRGQTPDEDDLRDNKKEGGRMHSFTLQQVQGP